MNAVCSWRTFTIFELMRQRLLVVLLIVATTVSIASSGAHAMSLPAPADWVDYVVRADGSSGIGLLGYPSGVQVTVSHCKPNAGCVPIGAPDTGAGVQVPPDAQVGDVFLVSRSDGLSATTLPYQGPVQATAAPGIAGAARVGAEVRATPGAWSGGFGRETSWLQLQACRDASGSGCVNLSGPYGSGPTCDATAVIPQRFTGWYLRAAEQRISSMVARAAYLPFSPETEAAIAPGPVVSVSVLVGPIASGPAPRGRPCVPPPASGAEVRWRARVGREQGELTVARVRCAETCDVKATLRRGRRSATVAVTAPYGRWTRVTLPPRVARRLGAGTLRLQLTVADGRTGTLGANERSIMLPRRLLTARR